MPASTELLQKGRYRIDSPASEPGSSSVYQAYDTTSDAKVYVKEIVVRLGKVTTLSQQENMRLAFENAARQMSELRHDSLLQVKDFYSEVGRQYLVLENVDGDDFQTLLEKNERPFAIEDVLNWADQLLDALHYLHGRSPSIVHKNISPRNIKLTLDGKVKLFSVALTDESGNELSTGLFDSADTGDLSFSPLELIWDGLDAASQKVIINSYDDRSERILKEPADARSDIYSLGATLYYLLTATKPVDPLERSIELLEGNPDPLKAPNAIDQRISPEIADAIMRALEIKRENRFDSATVMRQVLRTAIIRVKEREAAEAQELEEAAALLRGSQSVQSTPSPAEKPTESKPTEAEILAQRLREAEEMRLEAERRAAEAERQLREQEAKRARLEAEAKAAVHVSTEPMPVTSTEDDLLELAAAPVEAVHTSNQPVHEEDEEDIHLSIKPQPRSSAKFDPKPSPFQTVSAKPLVEEAKKASEPVTEVVEAKPVVIEEADVVYTEPEFVEEATLEVEETAATESIHDSFTFGPEPKRGLPMPLIAGVIAVIVLLGIGGFVFLGGSSGGSTASEQPAVQTQQPSAPATAAVPPATEQAPQSQNAATEPASAFTQDPNATEQTPETAPVAAKPATKTQKAAKPGADPAKTPAAKKPVTVDDLINDN